ncbi:hypothetical protein ZEAMMB73_Zm00001d043540 [Zea mays]|nr:hypothetical protein ZEAMMB73_Zm00001d043540 [Zea mays]
MPNKPLSALTLQDRDIEIQIEVHRKWEFRGAIDNGPILHIDMILTDCIGNAIHCQIPSFPAAKRGDEFQVGKIYKMSRFPVARAKSSYKPVDGDLMLYVTPYTTLELCHNSPSSFPLYVYSLTSYDKIDPNEPNARNFHDVISIITEISAIKPVGNARIPSSYNRHVLIKNLSDSILKITLWGKRAQEFYLTNTYDPQKQTLVIVLFVGCLPKEFQGEVLLSGGAAYHWYFNPSIEEATAFYNKIESEKINIELPSLDGQEITPPQLPQREHHDLKYILPLNPHDVPDEGYECTVTITSIPEGKTWYYIACNTCPNKPSIDPIIRQCSTCGSTKYCFRYKLTFKASDGTAEAEMFAFDTVARTIIGKPCPMVSRKLTYSPAKDKPETNPLDADKNRAPATTLESPTKRIKQDPKNQQE